MSDFSITEYQDLGTDSRGNTVLAGKEPALARQIVTFTANSAAGNSAAFNALTNFIRIVAEVEGDYAIGPAAVAVLGDSRLPANVIEIVAVKPGDRISIF